MEYNEDEAVKAKKLAEKKFEQKDIMGARKFAMKAHNLFPALDGLQPLLTTLNIYISAERKINGEVDWYGVLGVDPSSDDETVRRQYRKLALTLHPDKNKSVGAEGAFKILSEAWSILSDKDRRVTFDQKRKPKGIFQKVVPSTTTTKTAKSRNETSPQTRGVFQKVMPDKPSKPVGKNGLRPPANNGNFNIKSMNVPNPHSVPPRRNTFWTMCTSCKMQFEYVVFYLNKKLECFSCKEPFVAIEIPPPQTSPQTQASSHIPQQTSSYTAAHGNSFASSPATVQAENPGSGSGAATAQGLNGVQFPDENLKQRHDNVQVRASLEEVMKSRTNALKRANGTEANGVCSMQKPKRRRRSNGHKVNDPGKTDQQAQGNESAGLGLGSLSGVHGGTFGSQKVSIGTKFSDCTRELSLLETRNMLMSKAKAEILKMLEEWQNSACPRKASNKKMGRRYKEKTKDKVTSSNNNPNADEVGSVPDTSASANSETGATSGSVVSSMTVPDPDFHDFDKDRAENSFGDNQVWAAYDDDDGMPRYYAMIHSVISRKPFKMRISWLNSKSTAEFGPMNWVGCGFYKTTGNFRVGKYEINKSVNSFSHRVKWEKGARGAIQIYPSKGDVWALYKNWSPQWNEHTPDEEIHQYEMVEVVDEFNKKGISIIPLVKVAGLKTVFRQHKDQEQVKLIPREEMFRFSHQVPTCLLTGQESPGAPKGCWELDPAATPMELLQVNTQVLETKEIKKATAEVTDRAD